MHLRCPFCANVLKFQPTFWERIGLKTHVQTCCPTCQRPCNRQDASDDGHGVWALGGDHSGRNWWRPHRRCRCCTEQAMHRAAGKPHKDDTQPDATVEELVRTCMRHQRSCAGRDGPRAGSQRWRTAHLRNEMTNAVEVLAVLGTTSSESGGREFQQLVARHGAGNFVIYTSLGNEGRRAAGEAGGP